MESFHFWLNTKMSKDKTVKSINQLWCPPCRWGCHQKDPILTILDSCEVSFAQSQWIRQICKLTFLYSASFLTLLKVNWIFEGHNLKGRAVDVAVDVNYVGAELGSCLRCIEVRFLGVVREVTNHSGRLRCISGNIRTHDIFIEDIVILVIP